MKILKHLYIQVLIAVILAIIFAFYFPQEAESMKFFGDIFIKLVKMCIGPIIFCTIVSGIISSAEVKSIGRVGIKSLIYFEILTTLALIIGLALAMIIKPGAGMNIDVASLDIASVSSYAKQHATLDEFIMNIVPNTIFEAFTKQEILPILFISLIFGFALLMVTEKASLVVKGVEEMSHIFFKITGFVMRLAPLGAFGAMSYTIGKYGLNSLVPLAKLMLTFYGTCILFVIVILGIVMKICGSSIFKLLAFIKEEIFVVLGTSSSESALANLMQKMEKFGCPKSIVGIVVPSGYSFNLDGTCIYFTMAILFISQACNIDLSLHDILLVILVSLITSKGAAGVTGSGFIMLATTLSIMPNIPLAGLTLILGIDRFMSEARAVTNLIGNAVSVVAISKWESKRKS